MFISSVVEQYLLEVRSELAFEVCVEGVEAVIGLDVSPATDDADIEPVDVPVEGLVDAFLQLEHVFIGAQVVEGGQAYVLGLDDAFFQEFLVVLCDLDGSQVGGAPVIARDIAVVVQQLFQLVVEGVRGLIGVHLHITTKLYRPVSHSHRR